MANDAGIFAVTNDFENVRSFEIENGRYFSPFEESSGKNVAILGAVIADNLFEKTDPVGKQITIAGKKAYIIGVFKKEGKGAISDHGMDEIAMVPLNFGKEFYKHAKQFH